MVKIIKNFSATESVSQFSELPLDRDSGIVTSNENGLSSEIFKKNIYYYKIYLLHLSFKHKVEIKLI